MSAGSWSNKFFRVSDIGDLASLDQLAGGLVDATVQRVGEVIGAQELIDLVEDEVVGEDRAEQRHLRLVVVRGNARRDLARLA